MKILYISNTTRSERPYMDPAVRYRCYNPAYDLENAGHLADVIAYSAFNLDMVNNYDVFVFHKPKFSNLVEATVALAERRGKLAIADYDDLVFDKKNALESSLYLTGRASKKIVIDIFKGNLKALRLFKKVTVSTTELSEQVSISHPGADVVVVHNGLNPTWVDASVMRFIRRPVPGQISYFCGTKSHDHDFEIVEDVLAQFLSENKEMSLHVVGPLEFNREKFSTKQLKTTKAVPYEMLPPLIMQSWLNIAPLQDNLFNRCKSGLKFFEAAAFKVPTIASPIPDMCRFEDSEIVLAKTKEDWYEGLQKFKDAEFRKQAADSDCDYAMNKCMSSDQTRRLIDFISA